MSAPSSETVIPGTQLVTWGLVVVGWLVTIVIAWLVLRKNARNSWIGDIKKLIVSIEDSSIDFWMSENDDRESIKLQKLRREVKEITTLAMEIKNYGGPKYPTELFKQLRRVVTTEKYHQDNHDKLERKLSKDDLRIFEITEVCADLRAHFTRK